MENHKDTKEEINLSEVDWRNLSVSEFQKISQTIEEQVKKNKPKRERKKRTTVTMKLVTIRGTAFELPSNVIERLLALNDGKPKDKLIEEIFETYAPMESL